MVNPRDIAGECRKMKKKEKKNNNNKENSNTTGDHVDYRLRNVILDCRK